LPSTINPEHLSLSFELQVNLIKDSLTGDVAEQNNALSER
jgi:hypothetical protein